jgi:DNA-binding NarL/FixJ family response regulator
LSFAAGRERPKCWRDAPFLPLHLAGESYSGIGSGPPGVSSHPPGRPFFSRTQQIFCVRDISIACSFTGIVPGLNFAASTPQAMSPVVTPADGWMTSAEKNIRGLVMERRANRNNHPLVCLLSNHPLLLGEFTKKLSQSHFDVKAFRLHQVFFHDVNRLEIPTAKVYVVDGHDPFAPSLVGGLVKRFPNARVIVLSDKFTDSTAFPLLELGVRGLLEYSDASTHLPEAISVVAKGEYWVEQHLFSRFMDSFIQRDRRRHVKVRSPRLSAREREVLECLLKNLSNKDIAGELRISERTVKFHVSNLLAKFNVRRRVDLIMLHIHDERS